ncbi:cytochrome c family protein [Sphingomonas sp. NFR15]|uniref:c-type cytochrome n=1 Tax=Sphingomonas sp. NFR15 TaxID=1566282 RepID=UPI00088CEF34|nr:c-type cytochrome [Sphingomonas sp. NFR15]SDA25103.1 Cytochrome c2 [Sphingomonas sp. NFR15]
MPTSLRLIAALLVAATIAAIASIAVLHAQDVAHARTQAEQMTGGSVDRGKLALSHYGCGACHVITGVPDAQGQAGPSLAGIASRATIAGRLANQPDQMVLWLRHPQQVAPGNAMPDQRLSERNAGDIAAYLYTLRKTTY